MKNPVVFHRDSPHSRLDFRCLAVLDIFQPQSRLTEPPKGRTSGQLVQVGITHILGGVGNEHDDNVKFRGNLFHLLQELIMLRPYIPPCGLNNRYRVNCYQATSGTGLFSYPSGRLRKGQLCICRR